MVGRELPDTTGHHLGRALLGAWPYANASSSQMVSRIVVRKPASPSGSESDERGATIRYEDTTAVLSMGGSTLSPMNVVFLLVLSFSKPP